MTTLESTPVRGLLDRLYAEAAQTDGRVLPRVRGEVDGRYAVDALQAVVPHIVERSAAAGLLRARVPGNRPADRRKTESATPCPPQTLPASLPY